MVKASFFLILLLSGSFGFAYAPGRCVDLFLKGSEKDAYFEFQRSLDLGKKLMSMNNSQKEELLRKLFPAGFLIHGTSAPVVELSLQNRGQFFGSKSISNQIWSQSSELAYTRLRKNLSDYSTIYFYDSQREKSLQIPLQHAQSYADSSAKGFQVLKELNLDVEEFAELSQTLSSVVLGQWNSLGDALYAGEDYFSPSQIAKMDKILSGNGELSEEVQRISHQREGVILIFSREALSRVHSYLDPETGGRFFLLPPKKSLSMSDVLAIIPLSDLDLQDLQSLVSFRPQIRKFD